MRREERGEKLKNWFGECACQVCSGSAQKLDRSDRIRGEVAALHNQVFSSTSFSVGKSHPGEGVDQTRQTEGGPGGVIEEGQAHRGAGVGADPAGADNVLENDHHLVQLPWALLDFCELAAVNRAMKERGGLENEQSEDVRLSREEVEDAAVEDDFKRKAIALAATFGDSSVHRYEI